LGRVAEQVGQLGANATLLAALTLPDWKEK
jgi:hypothetical protein